MDVFEESLSKFRELMKEKGPKKVVEEFSAFRDNSGVFMPDIISPIGLSTYMIESFIVLSSECLKLEIAKPSSTILVHNVTDKAGAKSASWNHNDTFDWVA